MRRFQPILFFAGFLLSASGAVAQEAGQPYGALRQSLLAEGWKPDAGYGQKLRSGKPLYRYPEVVCGPQLCNAKWRDKNGEEQVIRLTRGYDSEDHRVAPQ